MTDQKHCRSTSPSGVPCSKPRGHRRAEHAGAGQRWTGGVNTPAILVRRDDGHLSEADHQTWARGHR